MIEFDTVFSTFCFDFFRGIPSNMVERKIPNKGETDMGKRVRKRRTHRRIFGLLVVLMALSAIMIPEGSAETGPLQTFFTSIWWKSPPYSRLFATFFRDFLDFVCLNP